MKIISAVNYQKMSRMAANIISAQVIIKSNSVLGLATGSTPIGTYKQLIHWFEKGDLDFSSISTVNLDEYRGVSPESEQSYHYFMHHNFFSQINIDPLRTFIPDGLEPNSAKACHDYDAIIRNLGGIDLQLLGLGNNGHIGFNEPNDVFEKETHCVDLSPTTLEANSRFFSSMEEIPKQAYTVGMKTIMQAKKILILVSGAGKADIVRTAFFGPITPLVPASILQLHPDVILIGDAEALSKIPVNYLPK